MLSILLALTLPLYYIVRHNISTQYHYIIDYLVWIMGALVTTSLLRVMLSIPALVETTFALLSLLFCYQFQNLVAILISLLSPHFFITLLKSSIDTYQLGKWIFDISSTSIFIWQLIIGYLFVLTYFLWQRMKENQKVAIVYVVLLLLTLQ